MLAPRPSPVTLPLLAIAWLGLGCGDDTATMAAGGGTESGATSGPGDSGPVTQDSTADASPPQDTWTDTGAPGQTSSSSSGDEPPAALCDAIAVSLVLDPDAPVFGAGAIGVYAEFFDAVVADTGAELRIRMGIGDLTPMVHFCLTEGSEAVDGDDLVWGSDGAPYPDARDALACFLAGADTFEGPGGDGDAMFEGLLGPIVASQFPPAETDVLAAMLVAHRDDEVNDAVSRPGLASEAFLRLGVDSDRRRATSFSWGRNADELETFTLAIGETSGHYDRGTWSLAAALSDWQPALVQACAEHETSPPPQMPGGCEHMDILFVVDGSLSMAQEQAALRGTNGNPPVFAEFTDALLDSLSTLEDFHVGVISSQPGDVVLHRHQNQPEDPPVAINECPLPIETNWIIGPNPDLADQFQCIAATLANTEETTAENAAGALHHPANAGFLRDDSVVLVVMLTDEDTQGFSVPRADVHRQILDAVGGDRTRLVVLSIAGDPGTFEAPKTVCQGPYGGASPARRLDSIVSTFRDQGLSQDICGGDLASVFDAVLDDVVDTCLDFHPEG